MMLFIKGTWLQIYPVYFDVPGLMTAEARNMLKATSHKAFHKGENSKSTRQ
jgi:hypothetical protein